MTLSDGDVAALADGAAELIGGAVEVRIEPGSGDDPYRWGRPFWLVHFRTGSGRATTVRLAAEDSEPEAAARLRAAAEQLTGGLPG